MEKLAKLLATVLSTVVSIMLSSLLYTYVGLHLLKLLGVSV